jgi:hypothetical protein
MTPRWIQIGDTVRCHPYTVQTMSGLRVDGHRSGVEGVVVDMHKTYDWMPHPDMLKLRIFSKDGDSAYTDKHPLNDVDLVTVGPGRFALGITHPYSPSELREQRFQAVVDRWLKHDHRHQGFSNAATYLAWLYLNQEPRWHEQVRLKRRRDGTINPTWARKAFRELGLVVDEWALAPQIEVPTEFKSWLQVRTFRPQVDWDEVAAQFKAQQPAECVA